MPELPEVETIRRGLVPLMVGGKIRNLEILDDRLVRRMGHTGLGRIATGTTIEAVGRRGKYLLLGLDDGSTLIHHLRMTGSFRAAGERQEHVRAIYHLHGRQNVWYRDIRRFGTLERVSTDRLDSWFGDRLGPEPLDDSFTVQWLAPRLVRRNGPVKAALLDQRLFCGVGNIYADEALFISGINPLTPANELEQDRLSILVDAVQTILSTGIRMQGSTLRDYSQINGEAGSMQDEFRVYGRVGEPCHRCGDEIESVAVSGRTTSFCPTCQQHR